MATLLGPNGQPFQVTRSPSANMLGGEWFTQSLSDRWTDATEAGEGGYLKSFDAIYRSQPVVAAVVNKIARRVATLPFGPFKLLSNGSREPVLQGDLFDLLNSPWERATALHLNHHVMLSLLVHGNALVALARGNGPDEPPTSLWPLDWAHVSAYGRAGGPIEWWSTSQFGGVERYVSTQEVLHFAWSAPSGSPVGVSPLEQLGVSLRLEDATQRHQTAMFRNGSRPSLAVSVEQENPRKEVLEFNRDRVEAMHKGVDNAGRTFFMGANARIQTLSMTPVETELIDQRRLNWDEVGMVYDLAGPLRGDLAHGTMANVEEILKSLFRDVLPPWTELIVQTYQAQLLAPVDEWSGLAVRFDFSDKLRGEPKELAETLKIEVEAGLRTRNEARYVLGLPPEGDPKDSANPANELTMAVNNLAPLREGARGARGGEVAGERGQAPPEGDAIP